MKKTLALILCFLLMISTVTPAMAKWKPDRNGYNTSTNSSVEVDGVCFGIPEYCTEKKSEEENTSAFSICEKAVEIAAIALIWKSEAQLGIDLQNFYRDKADICNALLKSMTKNKGDISGKSVWIGNEKAAMLKAQVPETGDVGIVIYNTGRGLCIGVLVQTDDSEYSYFEDLKRIFENAAPAYQTAASASGVTPSVKAALDAYEAFFDEYVEFLEQYAKNPTDFSLLLKYTTFMAKYLDTMEKLEAMENDKSMTTADLAYYMQVHARIMQKLSGVISLLG